MNRWIDLLASFGVAMLLHGLLVLGAVWFWTLRSPELRPVFQGGDVSLAVTFVAAAEGGLQTTDNRGQTTEKRGQTTEERRETTDDGQRTADSGSRKPGTTDILTDPETDIPEDGSQTTDDGLPELGQGRQKMDSAAEPLPEEGEDQDMLDAKTAAPVSAQASANAIEDGSQTTDDRRQTTEERGERTDDGLPTVAPGAKAGRQTDSAAEPPSTAFRQGVSGAVRMQSEIRPYYPLGARLRGEEGAVTVRVWVNGSGRALRCEVARSSGYPALDEAAVDAAQRARYVSTRPGAWRAEVETMLTFRFQLTE